MQESNPNTPANLEAEIDIDALSYGVHAIGRLNGKTVMVRRGAPGDRLRVRIVEAKERYSVAEPLEVLRPSPDRQTPPCPYTGSCGGCSWQHLQYPAQLKAKEKSVADALRRIGKLKGFELRPIVASPSSDHYRRRMRLQVSGDRLGFYGTASHHLVQIDTCYIAALELNQALENARSWLRGMHTEIDHIELVSGDEPQQIILVAGARGSFTPRDDSQCAELVASASAIHGVIVQGQDWRKAWGQTSITIKLVDELSLKVDGGVFTQVNAAANRLMIEAVLAAGDYRTDDRVLELYCGAGNFTLPIAKRTAKVTAVEGHRLAITDAKLSAQRQGLDNIHWLCAPVPRALSEMKKQKRRFTKVLLDPPRAGAKGVAADLASLSPERIAYVSCDPATLARDLADFVNYGYNLEAVQPFDFFPHTFHVETLALLTR